MRRRPDSPARRQPSRKTLDELARAISGDLDRKDATLTMVKVLAVVFWSSVVGYVVVPSAHGPTALPSISDGRNLASMPSAAFMAWSLVWFVAFVGLAVVVGWVSIWFREIRLRDYKRSDEA